MPGYGVKGVNPGLASGNSMAVKRQQSAALMQLVMDQQAQKKAQANGQTGALGPATGQAPQNGAFQLGIHQPQQQGQQLPPQLLMAALMAHLQQGGGNG